MRKNRAHEHLSYPEVLHSANVTVRTQLRSTGIKEGSKRGHRDIVLKGLAGEPVGNKQTNPPKLKGIQIGKES